MGKLVAGQIVRGDFPCSDGSFKGRPCIVLADWPFGTRHDALVVMVTRSSSDPNALPMMDADVVWGQLPVSPSYVRPGYLYAASEDEFEVKGAVKPEFLEKIIDAIERILGR